MSRHVLAALRRFVVLSESNRLELWAGDPAVHRASVKGETMREIPEDVRADAVLLVESYLWGTPTERNAAVDEIIGRAGRDGSVLLMVMWERLEKIGHQWDGDIELLLLRVTDRASYRG